MNERVIIVGHNVDGPGYYAMLANERTVLSGNTPLEAVKGLFEHMCTSCKYSVPSCKGNPAFGCGVGNDNVIECAEFKIM